MLPKAAAMVLDVVDDKDVAIDVFGGATRDPVELSAKDRAKVLRKLDRHILPLVSLMCFLSFLDRSNIANARVAGMSTDLNLVGLRYNIAAAVLYVPYCLAEIPSNLILKLFRPSIWIPTLVAVWGLIVTLMCLVNTYQGLIAARIFLGLAEGGVFPGVTYYISLWYPRAEQAKRMAIFFSAITVSGAFGSILAYGIEKMNGIGGLHGWQWIFCLEGIATVLIALPSPFVMCDYPETAPFLTELERRYIVESLKVDSQNLATHYNFQFILQALKDYKTYVQFGIYIGFLVPGYAISLFIPTIINELGFSAATAQLLSAPPFVAAFICTILAGIYSDRHQLRGPYVIAGGIVALIGYIILYTQTRPSISYVGAILAAMGSYPPVPVILTWASSNAGGDIKRGVAIGIVIGLSNLGGICAAFIYLDPPRFHIGHGTVMGWISLAMLLSLFAMWNYNRINMCKEKMCSEHGITDDHEDEFRELGDDSPLFRYAL